MSIRTATLDMPEHGLTEEVLSETDILVFWNHMFQDEFKDEVAERIQKIIDNAVHWRHSETRRQKPLDNIAVERSLEEEE